MRSFFKRLDDLAVLGTVTRPGAHVREAELFEQLADMALVMVDAEAIVDHVLKIDTPTLPVPSIQFPQCAGRAQPTPNPQVYQNFTEIPLRAHDGAKSLPNARSMIGASGRAQTGQIWEQETLL